ncbi:MAG TPA: hypothetical protein VJQ84_04545 [Solirubrobacterales bacterium]|nr:hypothetical protein [Solirubrobacterales bacterium]
MPAVDPIAWLGRLVARFAAWANRVGPNRVAYGVLALAYAIAAVLILVWGEGQTFINDEWNYLVNVRGFSPETLVHPQNGHLILVPLLIYKALFATVGADSHVPYQVVTVVLHLTVATLFFALVRSRLPLAAAVALTVLVAFFGAGWDTVMGAYEIPNLTGMATGLAALLALERRTAVGNVLACILLGLCLASFSVGIAFALGALFAIWLGGRAEWRRAWIVLVPAALYFVWFLWARKFGQSEVTAEALSSLFSGMADQLAALSAAITGLFRVPGNAELTDLIQVRPEWGYPLAILLGALGALHVRRAPRSIRFWMVAGTLVIYLALVAAGLSPARAPNASRYVYMGGILLLLLVVELGRDIRWSTTVGLIAAVFLALSLLANVAELRVGGHLFSAEGETNRATLTALELSREHIDPSVAVEDGSETHSHPDMLFPAYAYFEAAEDFGSPAYNEAELVASGEQAREAADQELVRVLGIAPQPLRGRLASRGPAPKPLAESEGTVRRLGGCVVLRPEPGRTASFQLELPPGGLAYATRPGTTLEVGLARFAEAFATPVPATFDRGEIAIPPDASAVPWRAEIKTDGRALACRH